MKQPPYSLRSFPPKGEVSSFGRPCGTDMSISDIMIHIEQTLSADACSSLEERVRQIDGVIAPRFNPGKEHLLLVAFDPDKTGPADLLGAVRSSGYVAQLVGV